MEKNAKTMKVEDSEDSIGFRRIQKAQSSKSTNFENSSCNQLIKVPYQSILFTQRSVSSSFWSSQYSSFTGTFFLKSSTFFRPFSLLAENLKDLANSQWSALTWSWFSGVFTGRFVDLGLTELWVWSSRSSRLYMLGLEKALITHDW